MSMTGMPTVLCTPALCESSPEIMRAESCELRHMTMPGVKTTMYNNRIVLLVNIIQQAKTM